MSTPDYAAELACAKSLALAAIESIDFTDVSEALPDELYSEDAAHRVTDLIACMDVAVTDQTESAYLTRGETR